MSQNLLDRVRIGTPCQTDWEAMRGDDRVRFCGQCEKHVYNLSQMSRQQAESLIRKTNGKLCARFERRADGGIVTTERTVPLPRFNFRFLRIASATMSAALSLAPTVAAKTSKNLPVLQQQEKKEKPAEQPQVKEKTAKIFGIVSDEHKAVIPKAMVRLVNFATKQEIKTETSADGTYELSLLEAGLFHLIVESSGFAQFRQEGIVLQNGQAKQIDVVMNLGVLVGDVVMIDPLPKRVMRQTGRSLLFPFRKLKTLFDQ
jgi:Carboxypeptidase regulatory-like domain